MSLKVVLVIGADSLDIEGDNLPFLAVTRLVSEWYAERRTSIDPEFRARVTQDLATLLTQGASLMATQQELSDELDAIQTAVNTVKDLVRSQIDQIAALQAQIAAGTPVTQEQLDALDVKADAILASLTPTP